MVLKICFIFVITLLHIAKSEAPGNEEKHRVVIVGAGVSGFAAAAALLTNNFTDFVVLEASDRVGGRIHTVEFGGSLIDKGAELVHGEKDNVVFELVSPHNLLVSWENLHANSTQLAYDITGKQYNNTLFNNLGERAWEIIDGNYSDCNGPMGEYFYSKLEEFLTGESVEPELGEAITHNMVLGMGIWNGCDDIEQLGIRGLADYVDNEGDLSLLWKPGTNRYKTIFDILSKKFPNRSEEIPVMDKIIFGKEVQRIDRDSESGESVLSCADGSKYRADHVIVTVSLGVLKKHAAEMFRPPLPQNKTDAIRTLGIGCVGKVFLLFPNRWWPEDVDTFDILFSKKQLEDFRNNSKHGYWTGYTAGFDAEYHNDRMLRAWFSGQSCRTMESLTDEQVTEGLLELMNASLGQVFQIPRPEAVLRTNWAGYNYTLGAYSFPTVDSDRLNVTRQHLSEPLLYGDKPVVMFAGEATHDHYYSTVHGALSSGRREANRLLQYINSHS